LQPDQIIPQNFADDSPLVTVGHLELHIILGASDPEDLAQRQVGQMAEVHISLVKYDDFTGLDRGTHFPRPLGIVVPGGIDNGKAG